MKTHIVMIVMGALMIIAAVISDNYHEANNVAHEANIITLVRDSPAIAKPEGEFQSHRIREFRRFDILYRTSGEIRSTCFGIGIALVELGVLAVPLSLLLARRIEGSARGPTKAA